MSVQDHRSTARRFGISTTTDVDVIDASFEITPASHCPGCGVLCALRLSPGACPYFHLKDHQSGASMIDSASSTMSVDLPRAVEDNLPSYYEHLSLSLLAPETPEEAPSPRRRRRIQVTALPLPDHMDCIGDFLEGVVAYVEVRSDLGDHSGAIGTLLYRMGASIVLTLSSSVTHAVLCSARSAIVRRAKSMGIQIVAARWVMACKDQLRRVEEEDWPMLPDAEDYKGLRQYRYKVSGVNETPSPMSVRNLALLSRARRMQNRNDGDSPLTHSSPGSPRRVWPSPRKSLRRVLFTRPDQLRPPTPSETGSEGGETEDDISMLSIPETQEITEVAETQDPKLPYDLPVPETDPMMFDRNPFLGDGDGSIEIPETQPLETHYSLVADPDFANLDLSAWGESAQSPATLIHPAPREALQRREETEGHGMGAGSNLEESFNSLSVHDRSAQPNANEQLEISSENMDMIVEQGGVDAETDDDPENQWLLPLSQGTHMELTRVLHVPPRKSTSRVVAPNATMVLTQPASTSSHSSGRMETFSHEVGEIVEPSVDVNRVSPSLELVLPQGTSQSFSSTASPTKENTALYLEAGRRSSTASAQRGSHKSPQLCSEEIAMSWSSLEKRVSTTKQKTSLGRQNPDSASMSFSLSERTEKRDSCASLPERRKSVELALGQKSTSSSKPRISDAVTPIPDRLQARVSGVFSDDNSPCVDTRRTIVLTGFKSKRSIVKGLKDLSKSSGRYDIANEVTTRTEVVVIEEHKRTLAVLLGISWGCWFVSPEWATKSIKAGRWLEFEKFEVRDYLAPMVMNREARTGQIDGSETKILRDLKVFVTRRGSLKPSADALQRMVLQAGGKVVFDSRQAHVYVGQSKPAKKIKCHYVTSSWIVESVATGQVQPFEAYLL